MFFVSAVIMLASLAVIHRIARTVTRSSGAMHP